MLQWDESNFIKGNKPKILEAKDEIWMLISILTDDNMNYTFFIALLILFQITFLNELYRPDLWEDCESS